MSSNDLKRFANLTYEDFKTLAKDQTLSQYEKIGFPDAYRAGKEEGIFHDITCKLTNLNKKKQIVTDIGPGCSDLAFMIINLCREQGHSLILIDSQEMLDQLPNEPFITKIPAYYPQECTWIFDQYSGKIDAILSYSVLHYVFAEGNLFDFLDRSLSLLSDSGEMLLGDVPNISKRKRFFSSKNGIKFHQQFTGKNEVPDVIFNVLEPGQIDDAVVSGIIARCQHSGFDAYCLPQPEGLPMANRRDDILIRKP
jgi:hypothetical protein